MYRNWKAKYCICIFAAVVLISLISLWIIGKPGEHEGLCVCIDGENHYIHLWHNNSDDADYAFIPSYAEIDDYSSDKVKGDYYKADLGNLPTVFVDTSTMTMKEVDNNKSHEEIAKVEIISSEGVMNFESNSMKIKGHGNSTWKEEKKPYELIFDDPVSILEMPEGEKWILLANALDESNIRNAIVYEFANSIAFGNVPEYRFVNVFLNGMYNGLYILTNSPKDSVDGNSILFQSDSFYELEEPKTILKNGISVKVVNENRFDKSEIYQVLSYISEVDKCITEDEKRIDCMLNIESWAKKYLIDEIFENYDSGITSSYFFLEKNQEGYSRIVSGPLWDYDNIIANPQNYFGTTYNPRILFASRATRDKWSKLWYSTLYDSSIFCDYVKEIYRGCASAALDKLIHSVGNKLWGVIDLSQKCDEMRWNYSFDEVERLNMLEWLEARKIFLDSLWIENADYHAVTLYTKEGENIFFVPNGCSVMEDPLAGEVFNGEFFPIGQNETYDLMTPIFEDASYTEFYSRSIVENIRDKVHYNRGVGLFAIFLFGVVVFLFSDLKRNRRNY